MVCSLCVGGCCVVYSVCVCMWYVWCVVCMGVCAVCVCCGVWCVGGAVWCAVCSVVCDVCVCVLCRVCAPCLLLFEPFELMAECVLLFLHVLGCHLFKYVSFLLCSFNCTSVWSFDMWLCSFRLCL